MQSNKKSLKVIERNELINLAIPVDVIRKIEYINSVIHDVEWSAVLFYIIVRGSIKKPNSLQLKVVDFLPMDKGTSGATEYEFDESVATYIMDNPHLLDAKIGHLHSHNNMKVFFSGTDNGELSDNCENHNFYLSLVVNNRMEKVAKVVFHGQTMIKDVTYTSRDENGNEYSIKGKSEPVDVMFSFDVIIQSAPIKYDVPNHFKERVDFIVEKSKVKKTTATQLSGFGYPAVTNRIKDFLVHSLKKECNSQLSNLYGILFEINANDNIALVNNIVKNYLVNYEEFHKVSRNSLDLKTFIGHIKNVSDELAGMAHQFPFVRQTVNSLDLYREQLIKKNTNKNESTSSN